MCDLVVFKLASAELASPDDQCKTYIASAQTFLGRQPCLTISWSSLKPRLSVICVLAEAFAVWRVRGGDEEAEGFLG